MTDERRYGDDERKDPPSEGVRIIGAEEAAEALERGDVAPRRGDDQPRYGDRPTAPVSDGPRPVLRFPLGSSSDPNDIERSPVQPAEPISEPVDLPHWTEPPTGEMPRLDAAGAGLRSVYTLAQVNNVIVEAELMKFVDENDRFDARISVAYRDDYITATSGTNMTAR